MKIRLILIICISIFAGLSGFCEEESDNANVVFRAFNEERINEYKEASNYYILNAPSKGALERFLAWMSDKLKFIFDDVPGEKISSILQIVIRIILWGIGIFAIIMVFITFFKHGIFNIVQKADEQIDLEYQNLEDQVLHTNWQELIDAEINGERFNVALRLLFLQTLQLLNEKQFIKWEENKTNHDYLRELRKTGHDTTFSKLMLYYNYGWFGDFEIRAIDFNKIQTGFLSFNNSLI